MILQSQINNVTDFYEIYIVAFTVIYLSICDIRNIDAYISQFQAKYRLESKAQKIISGVNKLKINLNWTDRFASSCWNLYIYIFIL